MTRKNLSCQSLLCQPQTKKNREWKKDIETIVSMCWLVSSPYFQKGSLTKVLFIFAECPAKKRMDHRVDGNRELFYGRL